MNRSVSFFYQAAKILMKAQLRTINPLKLINEIGRCLDLGITHPKLPEAWSNRDERRVAASLMWQITNMVDPPGSHTQLFDATNEAANKVLARQPDRLELMMGLLLDDCFEPLDDGLELDLKTLLMENFTPAFVKRFFTELELWTKTATLRAITWMLDLISHVECEQDDDVPKEIQSLIEEWQVRFNLR